MGMARPESSSCFSVSYRHSISYGCGKTTRLYIESRACVFLSAIGIASAMDVATQLDCIPNPCFSVSYRHSISYGCGNTTRLGLYREPSPILSASYRHDINQSTSPSLNYIQPSPL